MKLIFFFISFSFGIFTYIFSRLFLSPGHLLLADNKKGLPSWKASLYQQ